MRLYQILLELSIFQDAKAASSPNSGGRKITLPPPMEDTGIKLIPDAAHPFVPPGIRDQRGPCPGLNTMANHGYISHNGVASFEELVEASMEVFNVERDFAAMIVAQGILSRGNALTNQLSIGGPSPLVPPLPGLIDGPTAKGLATHGRFEGDISMTRQDAAIGDNSDFQDDLFDNFLLHIGEFGDHDPTDPDNGSVSSIVTLRVMQEFKFNRFTMDQKLDPKLEFHNPRFAASYGEAAFAFTLLPNGTTNLLSASTLDSFFRNQTFPKDWHRRGSPANFIFMTNIGNEILGAHLIAPGANNAAGEYVPDPSSSDGPACIFYDSLLANSIPQVLVTKTDGLLKENVQFLLNALFKPFGDAFQCKQQLPTAPSNT